MSGKYKAECNKMICLLLMNGILNKNFSNEKFNKSGRLDSNQRPLRPERSALPGCATARKRVIDIKKITLVSSRVDWIRTSDHLHPMQVRYRAAPPPELYR